MNEKQAIKKLRLLKTMQPTQTTLEDIKVKVYHQVRDENKNNAVVVLREFFENVYTLLKSYQSISYGAAFALLLIVFLSVFSFFLPNQLHKILLYEKLTLASNQYEKASIALADTTNRYGGNKISDANVQDVSQSIALANNELANLKLKGEKGKYTAQQCHQIYQEYLSYLERENQSISAKNKQSLQALKSEITTYEELAEKKLHMYNKL